MKTETELKQIAKKMRQDIAGISYRTKRGFLSTAYSSIEIMLTLYFGGIMRYRAEEPEWEERDRFILSKGHAGLALYLTLAEAGIINKSEMDHFSSADSSYGVHPVCDPAHGIEMSAGSLGHGLAFAIGQAYHAKLSGLSYKVYVLLGDGELQEGTNWEAFLLIQALNLDNLVVIIDRNNRQISGRVEDIVPLENMKDKLSAFGFDTLEADGHDTKHLKCVFTQSHDKPLAVIAHTIKGKGLSFVEDKDNWHGRGLSEDEWKMAKCELEVED